MTLSKRWGIILVLVTGVVGATLLFSFRLGEAAGTSHGIRADRTETALSAKLTITDPYAVFLPMIGSNAGALPPLFSVQMYGAVKSSTGLTQVAAAGVRWIRVPISWAAVEPTDRTPDQYNWSSVDAQVASMRSEGIEPLLTLTGNPAWAAVYAQGPVTDVADLQEFMGALVERYDGDGVDDAPNSPVVRFWEIYNEQDNTDEWYAEHGGYGFFGGRGEEYAAMLDAIYPVIRAASQYAQVVFGGIAHDNFESEGGPFDRDFVDDVLENCSSRCFDVMNFHYFPAYRFRWESYGPDVIGKTNYMRLKMDEYGFDRPLMCTETGWPSGTIWGSRVLQARYVVAGYVRGIAAGLELLNWFAWKDWDSTLPGLLDSYLQPKPAYHAYQTLTAQLGKGRYVRPLSSGETGGGQIAGYIFDVPGETEWTRLDVVWYDCPGYSQIPWADCPDDVSQVMSVPAAILRVTDLYGSESLVYDYQDGAFDGKVKLDIGLDPVFIEYVREYATYATNDLSWERAGESFGSGEIADFQADEDNFPNCRFGVGAIGGISQYDVASLNLGWYVNWISSQYPQPPAGVEYVQTIRLEQVGMNGWAMVSPRPDLFTATVQSNPGAMWMIGNEPDSSFQDDIVPEAYAYAYHDLYYRIKGLDATAQLGVGGIVQPTPLRFDYLDTVWNTYEQTYSETLPVDFWNIHSFILRELDGDPPDPDPCGENTIPVWGAFIPPGSTAQMGELYCVRDQDNLEFYWQRIRDFRQWMANKGEREKPLIVSEYGVLFPEDYSDEDGIAFSQERVGRFMTGTFQLMLNETDSLIGYPYDDNRLVQRWAWYSLNGDPYIMNGTLISDTGDLRLLGEIFRDYTAGIDPMVDLLAARAYAVPTAFEPDDVLVTVTLKAAVSNVGNISATLPITVTFYDGLPGETGTLAIGSMVVISDGLQGCADYVIVETAWSALGQGAHRFFVEVMGGGDGSPENNIAQGLVLIPSHRTFLPLVIRAH